MKIILWSYRNYRGLVHYFTSWLVWLRPPALYFRKTTTQTTVIQVAPIILLLTLICSGCGFHLRGMYELPHNINTIAIIVEQGHADLAVALRDNFSAYKRKILPPDQANYWLIIERDDLQQNIVSISSSTTARQYRLIYTLQFKFVKAHGVELLPSSTITVTRTLTINNDLILGSNDEERQLLSAMHQQAVQEIFYRLGSLQL